MKPSIVIIRIILVLFVANIYSQNNSNEKERVDYVKDTIYLRFDKSKSDINSYRGIKFYSSKEKGLIFNDSLTGTFIFKDSSKSDTLSIIDLKEIKISSHNQIEEKTSLFYSKHKNKLPLQKTQKLYRFYNKNDIFFTYLIEIDEKKSIIILYPVEWRNQNEQEINTRFKN